MAKRPPCTVVACVCLVLAGDLMLSGIIFGWAAIKQVLFNETQFENLCDLGANHSVSDVDVRDSSSPDSFLTTLMAVDKKSSCSEQTVMFSLIFTVGSTILSFGSLPVGFFLDATSPVHTNIAGGISMVGGLVMFAVADSVEADLGALFAVSYGFMGLGGCLTMLSSFPVAFKWPSAQSAILASVSCLFDASSVVFAILAQLYSANPNVFSREMMFLGYAVVALLMYTAITCSWVRLNNMEKREKQSELPSEDSGSSAQPLSRKSSKKAIFVPLNERPFLQQLKSFDFFVCLFFASIHMLRCNYFINVVDELLYVYDAPLYENYQAYTYAFSFILPVGIVFIPVIDVVIKKMGVIGGLHVTNGIGFLVGVLSLVPDVNVQIVNFLVFTMFRAFLYGLVGIFIAETFGLATLGRITGSVFTIAALINLLQYPAEWVTADLCGGNSVPVNVFMLCLSLVPVGLVTVYQLKQRRAKKHPATIETNGTSIEMSEPSLNTPTNDEPDRTSRYIVI